MGMVFFPTILVLLAALLALFGFPIFYWVKDRCRRGQPLSAWGLFAVALIGLVGVVAIFLFGYRP